MTPEQFRKARIDAGLSRAELAALTHHSVDQIDAVENGRRAVSARLKLLLSHLDQLRAGVVPVPAGVERYARQRTAYTAAHIAKQLGIGLPYYGKIESGKMPATLKIRTALAILLRWSPDGPAAQETRERRDRAAKIAGNRTEQPAIGADAE